jgi:hypothetical protein
MVFAAGGDEDEEDEDDEEDEEVVEYRFIPPTELLPGDMAAPCLAHLLPTTSSSVTPVTTMMNTPTLSHDVSTNSITVKSFKANNDDESSKNDKKKPVKRKYLSIKDKEYDDKFATKNEDDNIKTSPGSGYLSGSGKKKKNKKKKKKSKTIGDSIDHGHDSTLKSVNDYSSPW